MGIRFKSSYELSWLVETLIDGQCVSVPQPITYSYKGRPRTYHPDFRLGTQVIEIKPLTLISYEINKAKFAAAREFCRSNGLTFNVVTEQNITLLSCSEMLQLPNIVWNKGAKDYLNEQVCVNCN